ncbi:MAG: chemotaxis protein CheW [Desulforhopalus sp.]|nr:chemotaxis protein CheW [Desulforhopalus sp.]
MLQFLIFRLAGLRCALQVTDIERIIHAVAVNPVPKAPPIVLGLINVAGAILPVLNIRELFRLPEVEARLSDTIILTRTTHRPIALLVDEVEGVTEISAEHILPPDAIYPGIDYLQGVSKLRDGVLYIYNLDRFLSSADESAIDLLLTKAGSIPAPQGE